MATKNKVIIGAALIIGGAAIAAITLYGSEKAAQQDAENDALRNLMLADPQAEEEQSFTLRPDSICWEFTGTDLTNYCGNATPSAAVASCLDYYAMEIKTRGDYYHPARDTAITEEERQALACELSETYSDDADYNALGVNSIIPDHVNLGHLSD